MLSFSKNNRNRIAVEKWTIDIVSLWKLTIVEVYLRSSKSLTGSPRIFLNVPQQITKMAPAFQLSAVSQEDCCCRANQLSDHRHTRAHHLLKPAQGSDEGDKSQVIITQWSSAMGLMHILLSTSSTASLAVLFLIFLNLVHSFLFFISSWLPCPYQDMYVHQQISRIS